MKIDTDGRWQLYTNVIPLGSTALGTITRNTGDTGALVRIERTGMYVQVNAGVVRTLPQRAVINVLNVPR